MGEERMALQRFHDCEDTIMATDPQVIPLRHIVGQDHPRVLADA